MNQAYSYLSEHMNNGTFKIRVNKDNSIYENSKILFATIVSRHSNSTKYKVYCKYSANSDSIKGIEGWYCTCKAGMRTVGCCSHVAAIIYYFAYGKIPNPSEDLPSIFKLGDLVKSNKSKSKKNSQKHLSSSHSDADISSKLSHNSDESLDELEKSFKRLRSTDVEDEKNPKKKQMTDVVEVEELVNLEIKKSVNCLNLNDLKKRIPNWGGQLVD